MSKWIVTQVEVEQLARKVATSILTTSSKATLKLWGVPRGGIPAAYAISKYIPGSIVVDTPEDCDVIIDDIVDSGSTKTKWTGRFPGKPFFAMVDKIVDPSLKPWVVWPWEGTTEGSFEGNIERLLQFIGEDSTRGGLLETPSRVAKAWQHWASGYAKDPAKILKVFEDGAEKCDEMVLVKDIPIYSHCEHHLAPIFGVASIAYIPNGRIVGLSKLSRLADMFARRLQVQERMTNQIADALDEHLKPKGVGVVLKARHLCMESRGICQQGHLTITSALRGVIKDLGPARAEFLDLVR